MPAARTGLSLWSGLRVTIIWPRISYSCQTPIADEMRTAKMAMMPTRNMRRTTAATTWVVSTGGILDVLVLASIQLWIECTRLGPNQTRAEIIDSFFATTISPRTSFR